MRRNGTSREVLALDGHDVASGDFTKAVDQRLDLEEAWPKLGPLSQKTILRYVLYGVDDGHDSMRSKARKRLRELVA